MQKHINTEDVRLNYNPEKPQERFKAAGLEAALKQDIAERMPVGGLPWPAGTAPVAAPLPTAPPATDDLTKFNGYDAVVVTWTSAEAATLASLFTPGYLTSDWYEYRHDVASYIPLVTGGTAPFNDRQADMARYYHSLGLYFPCKIGRARVLLVKSGLHLDYDGPATPVKRLMAEIAAAVQPKIFITTGTGGGIGAEVALGDVVIAGQTRFFCTTQFKNEPWHSAVYKTTPAPAAALAAITPALTRVNAAKIPNARPTPKIWSAATDTIVTTDFFGFDDSTDYYKLQGPGHRACDMGDAMVGQALQSNPNLKWFAIRNASDPQIPDPNDDIKAADQAAAQIYAKYGAFTTAASVIATWAVIDALINKAASTSPAEKPATPKPMTKPIKPKTSAPFTVKFGRLPRTHDPRVPHLSAWRAGRTIKPAPASVDWTKGMPASLGMMLNDTLGDCTCAAVYHAMQVWTFNAGGKTVTQPDADVEKLYIQACGYNPKAGGEGPGGNEQQVLTYCLNTGAPVGPKGASRQKIAAFVEVDPRNVNDVKQTICDCGVAYIGFHAPQSLLPPDGLPPAVWNYVPGNSSIIGGHAVVLAGYTATGARVISWGNYYTMTWEFFAKFVDEVYAIADADWIKSQGTTPGGLTLAQLEAQMSALKGS